MQTFEARIRLVTDMMFIFNLPLDNDQKDVLRKRERSICSRYGLLIFIAAMASEYAGLDGAIAAALMLASICGASLHIAGERSRRHVVFGIVVLAVGFVAVSFATSVRDAGLTTGLAGMVLLVWSTIRGRSEFVSRNAGQGRAS